MDDAQLADLVWGRMKQIAPTHTQCGNRFEMGGMDGVGALLVCTTCSYFEQPSDELIDGLLAQATADVKAGTS